MFRHKIRSIVETDAKWIYEACQDEQIHYWTTVPRPYLVEHAQAFVRGEFPEYRIWVIENEVSRPVGLISIHSVNELGEADIGYWVAPWGRSCGATKEAIQLVEQFAVGDSAITSLIACISDLNTASQKVAESAGLKKSEAANKTCPAGCDQTSATIYRKLLQTRIEG